MPSLRQFKPAVSRRTLLLAAGCAWTIAGAMLIGRALANLIPMRRHLAAELLVGSVAGLAFYLLLFARLSRKHVTRITLIPIDNPCFFSFFNARSYALMFLMIGMGVTLRRLDVVDRAVLYTGYLAMGLPLLISAYRFFYSWGRCRPG